MIILIPLGGTGQRFKKNGYKNPKGLINIFGKPIIHYLLDNLNIKEQLVYIPYNKEYKHFSYPEDVGDMLLRIKEQDDLT